MCIHEYKVNNISSIENRNLMRLTEGDEGSKRANDSGMEEIHAEM